MECMGRVYTYALRHMAQAGTHLCCSLYCKINSIAQIEVGADHSYVAWPAYKNASSVLPS